MSIFFEMVDEVKDMIEPPRERFYDERDEEPDRPEYWGRCGNCDEFIPCRLEGHEQVGWCMANVDFCLATDPDECD